MLLYLDDCRETEKIARELLRVYRAAGRSVGLVWPFWRMGMAQAGLGSHVRARVLFRQVLALSREMGESPVTYLHHLGNVELALGNLAEARRRTGS